MTSKEGGSNGKNRVNDQPSWLLFGLRGHMPKLGALPYATIDRHWLDNLHNLSPTADSYRDSLY